MSDRARDDQLAGELYRAMVDRAPIEPLTATHPELQVADAYAIQQRLVARILDASGGRQVGFKLGLTSAPMQEMLGIDVPDYAPVLSSMVHDDGQRVDLDTLIQPKVEAEIALVLDEPLRGPGVTTLEARRAIGGAVAAIEVVDSRIRDWRITFLDTVSDLASSAAAVLSSHLVPLDGWSPRRTGVAVYRGGRCVDTGAGAAALGDPVAAVAWLANTVAAYDVTLEAGWFIMTGALHRAFDVEPGDVVRADFDRLGSVTARFE